MIMILNKNYLIDQFIFPLITFLLKFDLFMYFNSFIIGINHSIDQQIVVYCFHLKKVFNSKFYEF